MAHAQQHLLLNHILYSMVLYAHATASSSSYNICIDCIACVCPYWPINGHEKIFYLFNYLLAF